VAPEPTTPSLSGVSNPITPVVLSGGAGTRLWPLSLPSRPKQLHALVGPHSLLQETVRRLAGLEDVTGPVIVCNEVQTDIVRSQLEAIEQPPRQIIVEPAGRNTAPAVAAAALTLDPGVVMVVLPADHLIADVGAFCRAMSVAVEAAADGHIVSFGVVPTRADTGFGYIEVGAGGEQVRQLLQFVEKPDLRTAGHYLASGNYLWNSGMFVFTAGAILEQLGRYEPDLLAGVAEAVADAESSGDTLRLAPSFATVASISLDYAVMERVESAVVVALDAGWSDVGSWQALWEVTAPHGETVTIGPVRVVDVARSYVRAETKPVAVIGLDDVVVVETDDAVLVMDRRRAQDVREVASWFEALSRSSAGSTEEVESSD
jgi:mannose-1-phosphate guanylyltransferase/mannose-6-phosphate isomerase